MNKRLASRHQRQVNREKKRVADNVTSPETRTPEEIQAARDAGRAAIGRGGGVSAFGNVRPMRTP
jgi:hypothetical protein